MKLTIHFGYLAILSCIAVLGSIILNLSVGYAPVSWASFFDDNNPYYTVAQLRVHRVWAMCLVGVSIPTAGFLLQEYFQNPLAGPSVLGISSVASLAVAGFIFWVEGYALSSFVQYGGMSVVAILGSMLAMLLLLGISSRFRDSAYLIILGFLISSLSGAIISLLQLYGENQQIKTYILWSFGANHLLDRTQLWVLSALVIVGVGISFFTINPLIANVFGRRYAQSFGVQISRLQWLIVMSSSVLSASVTAFLGPILFVGIVIPHLSRMLYSPARLWHQWVLNMLLGVFWLQVFSIISEWGEIPINVITSLLGIPMIFLMMLKPQKKIFTR